MEGPSFWLGVLVGLVMLTYDAWYNSKRYALSRWAKTKIELVKKIHVTGSQWVKSVPCHCQRVLVDKQPSGHVQFRTSKLNAENFYPWNFRLRGRDSDLSPGYSSLLSPDSWVYSFEVMEVENCGRGFAFSFLFYFCCPFILHGIFYYMYIF